MKHILAALFTFTSSAIAAAIAPRDLVYVCPPDGPDFHILPVRTRDPRQFVYCLHGNAVIASCPSQFRYYDLEHNTCVL
ncbi:hypothetical protein PS15m_002395 [Mucor circinelloides]